MCLTSPAPLRSGKTWDPFRVSPEYYGMPPVAFPEQGLRLPWQWETLMKSRHGSEKLSLLFSGLFLDLLPLQALPLKRYICGTVPALTFSTHFPNGIGLVTPNCFPALIHWKKESLPTQNSFSTAKLLSQDLDSSTITEHATAVNCSYNF